MTDKNNDLIKKWYKTAIADFNAAETLDKHMNPKPLEIIGFHCQQAAEKLLKGFLASNSIEPPKIHDIQRLCEMCMEINGDFEKMKAVCEELNPYSVQTRYPSAIELLETDIERALQSVQTMIEFFEAQGIVIRS